MGPQHPSTHGVLRVILKLDGEKVLGTDCVIGYLHRGVEKIAENRTYVQFNPYVDRMDYVAAVSNGLGYCEAVEKLLGVEAPERAKYIRVILTELNRLASHQVWLGTHALDIGALTPLFYCFRDREEILKIFEKYCGARLTTHAFRIGGCQYEIYEGFEKEVLDYCDFVLPKIDEYEELLTTNRIWLERTKGVGVLTGAECIELGATGPVLRGSGVKWDLRKAQPYAAYAKFEFDIPIGKNGDTYDRYLVRIEEMRQSVRILRQAASGIPEGPITGEGAEGAQAAGRRNLSLHRGAQRRARILHRERRLDAALPRARSPSFLRKSASLGQDGPRVARRRRGCRHRNTGHRPGRGGSLNARSHRLSEPKSKNNPR